MERTDNIIPCWDTRSIKEELKDKWSTPLSVFVPCYNEQSNIADTLNSIFDAMDACNIPGEVLVVDDGSTDQTAARTQEYMQANPQRDIRLLVRKKNKGIAQNYVDAAFIAKGKYYKLVSGDNAEPKETLIKIFRLLGQADMIIPYHTQIKGRGPVRHFLSKGYTFLVNFLTGNRFKYYNGGAVHLTYNIMRWHTDHHGYSFQADIITKLVDQGMSFVDVPVVSQERTTGRSQAVKLNNFLSVGYLLVDLPFRRMRRRYRGLQVKE